MREADVRRALATRIASDHSADPTTRIIHEFALSQSGARIDVAAVNGRLMGWEIKTAADTLVRLERQSQAYSRIFDNVWLVADERHIDSALGIIPDWWGVLRVTTARDACRIISVRPSRLNRKVDLAALVQLLWRSEVMQALQNLNLSAGLEHAPRRELWKALACAAPKHVSATNLRTIVRETLKSREGWRVDQRHTSGDD